MGKETQTTAANGQNASVIWLLLLLLLVRTEGDRLDSFYRTLFRRFAATTAVFCNLRPPTV